MTGPGLILSTLPAGCLLVSASIHLPVHPHSHRPSTNDPSRGPRGTDSSPSLASPSAHQISPPGSSCVSSPSHPAKQPTAPQSGARRPRWSRICFGVRKKKFGQMLEIGRLKFALQDAEPGEITPPLAGSPSVCPAGCRAGAQLRRDPPPRPPAPPHPASHRRRAGLAAEPQLRS